MTVNRFAGLNRLEIRALMTKLEKEYVEEQERQEREKEQKDEVRTTEN